MPPKAAPARQPVVRKAIAAPGKKPAVPPAAVAKAPVAARKSPAVSAKGAKGAATAPAAAPGKGAKAAPAAPAKRAVTFGDLAASAEQRSVVKSGRAAAAPLASSTKSSASTVAAAGATGAASASPAKKKQSPQKPVVPADVAAAAGVVTPQTGKPTAIVAAAKKGLKHAKAKSSGAAAAAGSKKAGKRKAGEGQKVKPFKVLQLRFLPPAFQEPELERFLTQFGTVTAAFCARQRRTNASTGVAYVQLEDESLLPQVVEECNGMLLGGRVVRAKRVTLKRKMPSRAAVSERRFADQKHRYRGDAIPRFDATKKDFVAVLVKQAATEKRLHHHLQRMGIEYTFTPFQEQLRAVPAALRRSKSLLKEERSKKAAARRSATKAQRLDAKERLAAQRAAATVKGGKAKKGRGAREATVIDRDPIHKSDDDTE